VVGRASPLCITGTGDHPWPAEFSCADSAASRRYRSGPTLFVEAQAATAS